MRVVRSYEGGACVGVALQHRLLEETAEQNGSVGGHGGVAACMVGRCGECCCASAVLTSTLACISGVCAWMHGSVGAV